MQKIEFFRSHAHQFVCFLCLLSFCSLSVPFLSSPLATALCSTDPRLRMQVAEYLLPGLLKIHAKCPLAICSEIRALPMRDGLAADLRVDTESWTRQELEYFGLVHVCLQARLAALPTGCELQDGTVFLSHDEMKMACLSGHSDLRLTALNALVASSKTTHLPSAGTAIHNSTA